MYVQSVYPDDGREGAGERGTEISSFFVYLGRVTAEARGSLALLVC